MKLTITENAVQKAKEIRRRMGKPEDWPLHIGLQGGGCSGFKYSFSIDNNLNANDILIGKVLVDKTSHEFIKNSKLDYEENLMGKSFRINNPDAIASCGCGISFSV